MKIYYNKLTNQVKMYSENSIKYDAKKLSMTTIKDIDFDKMNFNYDIKVINSKLNFTEKINEVLEKKKELETELENANDLNKLKQIIKKLL